MKISGANGGKDIWTLEKSPFPDKMVFYTAWKEKTGRTEKRNDLDHGTGEKNPCGGRG